MEKHTLKDAKKQFSRVGLILFLGSLLIYTVQTSAVLIFGNFPAIIRNDSLFFLSYMLPTNFIAYPLVFLMFKKVPTKMTGREAASQKKMPVSHLLISFCIAYAGTTIFNLLGNLLTTIIGFIKQSPVNNVVQNLVTTIEPLPLFICVVIFAPIMEEILFRKLIIDRTVNYGEALSILFSGLVFGLFHGNLNQFCYAFFLGAFFSFIYIRTRNILYPILLHMLINFFSGFLGALLQQGEWFQEYMAVQTEEEMINILLNHLGEFIVYAGFSFFVYGIIIAGIAFFFANRKKLAAVPHEEDLPKGLRFKAMLLNPGVILFCLLWISAILRQLIQ